jgi:hypothetical protein
MKHNTIKLMLLLLLSCSHLTSFCFCGDDSLSTSKVGIRKTFNIEKTRKIMMATLAKSTPFYNKDSVVNYFKKFFANANVVNYNDYVEGITRQLRKKINILEYDDIRNTFQLDQLTDLRARYSLVNSATCFVDKNDGTYIRTKDMTGQYIMTQPLENIEKYAVVDNFNQGFARVKKTKIGYGFINICGDEMVKCQYNQAQNFNDGFALVKKDKWFFVNTQGQQSEELVGVTDAIALTKGISLVRFNDGKYALIDNLFAKTHLPISAIYDSIEPLSREAFKVKLGTETRKISIDGLEIN